MPGMPRRNPAPVADTLRRYRGRIHAQGHSTGLKAINFLVWQMVLRALIYRRGSGHIYSFWSRGLGLATATTSAACSLHCDQRSRGAKASSVASLTWRTPCHHPRAASRGRPTPRAPPSGGVFVFASAAVGL
jgi:hypothetical protein